MKTILRSVVSILAVALIGSATAWADTVTFWNDTAINTVAAI